MAGTHLAMSFDVRSGTQQTLPSRIRRLRLSRVDYNTGVVPPGIGALVWFWKASFLAVRQEED
jgi:hypothetical protein